MELNYEILSSGSLMILFGLLFLASFIDSIAGGGGLISLPAYMLTGMPVHYALGSNKFTAACGTLFALGNYLKSGMLEWRIAAMSAVFSFAGSACGTQVALHIDGDLLKKILVVVLPLAAVVILTKRNLSDEDSSGQFSMKKKLLLASAIGLGIGFYDGLIGPGTGTFAAMAYCLIMKYDLRTASGNAKMLNLASNVASMVTFALAGTIAWKIALPGAVFSIIGGQIGSRMAIARGAEFIRPMLVVVLVLMMVKLAGDVFL